MKNKLLKYTINYSKIGGGKQPTFQSTKKDLNDILKKVKPDDKYYNFSLELIKKLNIVNEKKFYNFVNLIYQNFKKINSISIKHKGGMPGKSNRGRGDLVEVDQGSSLYPNYICAICMEKIFDSNVNRIVSCNQCNNIFHLKCIQNFRNNCPLCRKVNAFDSVFFPNTIPIQEFTGGPQINQIYIESRWTEEERAVVMQIREEIAIERTFKRIKKIWISFLLLFLCYTFDTVWRENYSSNFGIFLSLFWSSIIAVELLPINLNVIKKIAELIIKINNFLERMSQEMIRTSLQLGGKNKIIKYRIVK